MDFWSYRNSRRLKRVSFCNVETLLGSGLVFVFALEHKHLEGKWDPSN